MGDLGDPGTSTPYGKRLLCTTVDEIACNEPDRVFACIPRTTNLQDGFRDITFADFARAVDRVAWWLEEALGKSTDFETIAYLGPSDLRYFVIIMAASKIGYQLFLPSPRNSLAAQLNLFANTSCNALVTTPSNAVQEYLEHRPMQLLHIMDLEELLRPGEVVNYKFIKTFEEARADPSLILHTSGSTGFPKPLLYRNEWGSAIDATHYLLSSDGCNATYTHFHGKRIFCCLPPFHCALLAGALISSVFFEAISVWAPPNKPLSAILVEEMLDSAGLDVIFCAPSILEDMSRSSDAVSKLSRLDTAIYGGGSISYTSGEIVRQAVRLVNAFGTTETLYLPFYQTDPEDWEYFHINPEHKGFEMRSRAEDMSELVIVRHPSTDRFHSAFVIFPHLTELPLNDLYSRHPTKPNHWRHMGRADDIVVLSNGENVSPFAMEAALNSHPDVSGALVVGQGKFATSAIIELSPDLALTIKTPEDRANFVEDLWPYVVLANSNAPGHAQLAKDRLMIAPEGKRFLRAGKGSVQRAATVKFLKDEIEELYTRTEQASTLDIPELDLKQDMAQVCRELSSFIRTVTSIQLQSDNQDFFVAGMDSLHVMQLAKSLESALSIQGATGPGVTIRVIYTNPTLESLANALINLGQSGENGARRSDNREEKMLELLQKYEKELTVSAGRHNVAVLNGPQQHIIILTGSTGFFGSYILDNLATNPAVRKVYCLNRKANAGDLQTKSNRVRGLDSEWGSKVEFLQADLSKPQLCLSEEDYARLSKEATLIIHNQWQVDFNLSLPSFEPHIAGVANLIAFSANSPNVPGIIFTSSIDTVRMWGVEHPGESVPEVALTDPRSPGSQGYSESKWIAERLLDFAGKSLGVPTTICRVGQIGGPVERGTKGMWNTQEWLPSIIASSKYLGLVPESIGSNQEFSWTPVDILARALVEIVIQTPANGHDTTTYYHLDNPQSFKWSTMVPIIQQHFSPPGKTSSTGTELKIVSFQEWVKALRQSGTQKDTDVAHNPGLKLLEFYETLGKATGGSAKLDMTETVKASSVLRNVKAADGEWMRLWLQQWNF